MAWGGGDPDPQPKTLAWFHATRKKYSLGNYIFQILSNESDATDHYQLVLLKYLRYNHHRHNCQRCD